MSWSENEASLNRGPLDPSAATKQLMTIYSMGAKLTTVKAGTKVVRCRGDRGLRGTN